VNCAFLKCVNYVTNLHLDNEAFNVLKQKKIITAIHNKKNSTFTRDHGVNIIEFFVDIASSHPKIKILE